MRTINAGLLQATSLTFVVAATQTGEQLHLISSAISVAFIASGLFSVIIYPHLALTLLPGTKGKAKLDIEE